MNERENILGRVREALKQLAPRPGDEHSSTALHPSGVPAANRTREWLPRVGEGPDAMLADFTRIGTDLKTEVVVVGGRAGMIATVRSLRDSGRWTSAATHSGELTGEVAAGLDLPVLWTDRGYDAVELEECSVGITECDALVAQTGSVLVTSRSAGGRALSVLPPHHVVLARRSQLLADLPAAFSLLRQKYAGNYPSLISLITGPSRTGDIERILVLGAHGPKRMTVVIVSDL